MGCAYLIHQSFCEIVEDTVLVQSKDSQYFEWVLVQTDRGGYWVKFSPKEKCNAYFKLGKKETAVAAYSYSSRHGLCKLNIANNLGNSFLQDENENNALFAV